MSLLPVGIDNAIVEYRAKTKEIVVNLNDAGGRFGDLEHYDAYFYAKKYPIDPNADLDVSIGYTFKDNSTGTMRFDLLPIVTDIEQGDYVYEIVLFSGNTKITIVKDRLKIIRTLNNDYGIISFDLDPSKYTFTLKDLCTDISLTIVPGVPYHIIDNEWLSSDIEYGEASTIFRLCTNEPYTSDKTGIVEVSTEYETKYIDVNYIFSNFVLDVSSLTFTPYITSIPVNLDVNDIDEWEITNIPEWLNVDVSSGTGPTLITFSTTVDANTSIETLDVSSLYSYPTTLDASFNYRSDLVFTPDIAYLDPYNTSISIDVSTSSVNSWELEGVPSWLTINKTSGIGPDTLLLSVDSSTSKTPTTIDASSKWDPDIVSIDVSYGYETTLEFIDNPIVLDARVPINNVSIDTASVNYWDIINVPGVITFDKNNGLGDTALVLTNTGTNNGAYGTFTVNSNYADDVIVNYEFLHIIDRVSWGFDNTLESDENNLFLSKGTGSYEYTSYDRIQLDGAMLYIWDFDYTADTVLKRSRWIQNMLSPSIISSVINLQFIGGVFAGVGTHNLLNCGVISGGLSSIWISEVVSYAQHPLGNWGDLVTQITGSFYGHSFTYDVPAAYREFASENNAVRFIYIKTSGTMLASFNGHTCGTTNIGIISGILPTIAGGGSGIQINLNRVWMEVDSVLIIGS